MSGFTDVLLLIPGCFRFVAKPSVNRPRPRPSQSLEAMASISIRRRSLEISNGPTYKRRKRRVAGGGMTPFLLGFPKKKEGIMGKREFFWLLFQNLVTCCFCRYLSWVCFQQVTFDRHFCWFSYVLLAKRLRPKRLSFSYSRGNWVFFPGDFFVFVVLVLFYGFPQKGFSSDVCVGGFLLIVHSFGLCALAFFGICLL